MFFFVFTLVFFKLEFVQNYFVNQFAKSLSKNLENSIIKVGKSDINYNGRIAFEDIIILNQRGDTLAYFPEILSKIDIFNLIFGNYNFEYLKSDNFIVNAYNYGEEQKRKGNFFDDLIQIDSIINSYEYNLNIFCDSILLKGGKFIYKDVLEPNNSFSLEDIKLKISYFKLNNFIDNGFSLDSLSFASDKFPNLDRISFKFNNKNEILLIDDFVLSTKNNINLNLVALIKKDLAKKSIYSFTWDLDIFDTKINTNDLAYFDDTFNRDKDINFKFKMKGLLNELKINLELDDNKLEAIASINDFRRESSKINLDITNLDIFPNSAISILDTNKLKNDFISNINNFEKTNLKGTIKIENYENLSSNITAENNLLKLTSDISLFCIDSNSSKISYNISSNIYFSDIGKVIGVSGIGESNIDIDIIGKGFSKNNFFLNSNVKVNNVYWNEYFYKNLTLQASISDKNLGVLGEYKDNNLSFDMKLDLDRLADFIDLELNLNECNLHKLNISKDTISNISSNINLRLYLPLKDKFKGEIDISNTVFENSNSIYSFNDLAIGLEKIENNLNRISFESNNAINGHISFNFDYSKSTFVFEKIVNNFYKLKNERLELDNKSIYLDFDIKLHNSLISPIFPNINFLSHISLVGNIDNNKFKLNFNSSKLRGK